MVIHDNRGGRWPLEHPPSFGINPFPPLRSAALPCPAVAFPSGYMTSPRSDRGLCIRSLGAIFFTSRNIRQVDIQSLAMHVHSLQDKFPPSKSKVDGV